MPNKKYRLFFRSVRRKKRAMPDIPANPLVLHLFGPLELFVNEQPVPRPRARAGQWILALLALRQEHPIERTWLASLLWPESSHEHALYNLRRNLTDIRQLLGPEGNRLFAPTPRTLCLDLDGAYCDVLRFDGLIKQADSGALQKAVALYRGALLPECSEEWAVQERRAREQAYLTALETLAARASELGNHPEAVSYLKQILALDAFRETALCDLIKSLTAAGDLIGATLAYREYRLLLHQELRSEPAAETQAIYRRLRQGVNDRPRPFVSLQLPIVLAAAPHHLPRPLSGFIGRQEEKRQIQNCLEQGRFVTLTGPGGVGKTRLAIAVAESMRGEFKEGVWFVDLAPLSEAELVSIAIATCLGVAESSERSTMETLLQYLASKEMLIILDNCEHLMEACAAITQSLLQAGPTLRILATSRQALGLGGEVVWRVPSLAFPTEEEAAAEKQEGFLADRHRYDALHLFEERARESYPGFTLHPRNIATVTRICRRLDGTPLAIELAAARIRSLPLEEIDARLRTNFRLLRGGLGAPLRQETLAAVFAWSWELLAPRERLLLERLSVFAGGWTLSAAEAICSDEGLEPAEVIDLLLELVDRSLVAYAPPRADAESARSEQHEARYSLLETTRHFASERLAESGAARELQDGYCDYFLALAEEIRPKLWKEKQAWWFARLEVDHHNLRTALEWCRKQESIEKELRFVLALSRFWDTHGHLREGFTQLKTTLARVMPELHPQLYATALGNAGWMASMLHDNAAGRHYYERAIAICQQFGYESHLPSLLNFLACSYSMEGDVTRARPLFEEANALCLRAESTGLPGISTRQSGGSSDTRGTACGGPRPFWKRGWSYAER